MKCIPLEGFVGLCNSASLDTITIFIRINAPGAMQFSKGGGGGGGGGGGDYYLLKKSTLESNGNGR